MSFYDWLKAVYRRRFNPEREHAVDLACWLRAGTIVDLGCGRGAFARLEPARIIGLDANFENLRSARAAGARVASGRVTRLPLAEASVQGVYCSHVIEHLSPDDARQLLGEIARVLGPGGILVLKSPMPHPHFYDEPSHIRPYPPNAVLHLYRDFAGSNPTLQPSGSPFELVSLRWRRPPLLYPAVEPSFGPRKLPLAALQKTVSLGLSMLGLNSLRVDGYTLVLRKAA